MLILMDISLFRFVYKTIKNTVAPDMLQQAKLRSRMKQRVVRENGGNAGRGEGVANWSSNREHATIRYDDVILILPLHILFFS